MREGAGKPGLAKPDDVVKLSGLQFMQGMLLDSALGCAVQTTLPVGRAYTTAELSVNIVRVATHKTGPLRAVGNVIHSGRQLATAEARIVGPDGKLCAHGTTTTCLIFEVTSGADRQAFVAVRAVAAAAQDGDLKSAC